MRRINLQGGSLIGVIFLLAAVLRLSFIFAHHNYLGGDEAIVGLMAKHMLEGKDFPLFFYGQPYMGSLEAMLAALLFALGGISNITLRLSPFIFSMLFLVVLYLSAKRFTTSGFPTLPLLVAALPPVFFVRWSIWARGGFIEVLFWGQLSLLLLSYVMEYPSLLRYYLLEGLTLGLGFWTNPLAMPYLLAVGCWLLVIVFRQKNYRWRFLFVLVLFFVLGTSPLIIYNLIHPGATAIYLVKSFVGITRSTWDARGLWGSLLLFLKRRLWLHPISAPRSLADLFRVSPASPLNWLSWLISFSLLALFLYRGLSRRFKLPKHWQHQMALCYSLLLLITLFLGCSGKYIPRYFLPIYSVYPIAFGLVFSCLRKKGFVPVGVLFAMLIVFNVIGNLAAFRDRIHRDFLPLIGILDQLGVNRGYADYETAYCINFQSREKIVLSPMIPTSFGLADRYPKYTEEVDKSATRVYIFISDCKEEKTFVRELRRSSLGFEHKKVNGYCLYHNVDKPFDSLNLKKLFLDGIEPKTS